MQKKSLKKFLPHNRASMKAKVCNKCGNEKPISEFQISHDGYRRHFCKDCRREQLRVSGAKWRERNREKYTAYHEKYRTENSEKIKAYNDAHKPPPKRKIYPIVDGKKECSDCKLILEVAKFYPTVSPKRKTYYSHKCRKCTRAYLLNLVGEKECPKCNTVKQYSEFRPNKEGYDRYCKVCRAEIQRDKYRNDPEFKRRWRETSAKYTKKNQAKRTEYFRKWKARNPEKWKQIQKKYRAKATQNNKEYFNRNPERVGKLRKANQQRSRKELMPSYVRTTLKTKLRLPEIPKEVIELQKSRLLLHREIKTKK